MIEHIMRAIMRFSERVVCLDAGRVVADGTPAQVANDRNVRRIYLGA
jgi:branched-chain amino acid transport system ATP-binding protein